MKIIRLLLIANAVLIPFALNAEPLPESSELLDALDADVVLSLDENNHVFRYDEELLGITYYPGGEGWGSIARIHRLLKPEVMVEALYRLPYPDGVDPDSGEVLDLLYDLSHQVSSISGARYFSVRKQDYEILFTDVYAVNNLEDKIKIGNPVPDRDSSYESIYLHMKENALGDGFYLMNCRMGEKSMSIKITNETELGFIIPAVSAEDMVIYLQLLPCSDSILIYGYCGVVLQNDPLVHLMLDPYYAFYRRMTAMETWLHNSLHGTDALPQLLDPLP